METFVIKYTEDGNDFEMTWKGKNELDALLSFMYSFININDWKKVSNVKLYRLVEIAYESYLLEREK